MKIKIICKECGKEYLCHECYIRRDGKRLYCSQKCYSKNLKGAGNPRYNPIDGWIKCKGCGNLFKVKPCSIRLGKHKRYCSNKCKQEHIGKILLKCMECKNEFLARRDKSPKFCSRSCSAKNKYRLNGQVNKGVQRGNGGKREDLDNMYLRSSWEANYARYLNFIIKNDKNCNILKWEYEADTFEFNKIKRGTKFYTPDFKIFKKNGDIEYHEVKGWMDAKSITRAKRMAKYYPTVKIIIIDKTWFRRSGIYLSKIIPFWEKKY